MCSSYKWRFPNSNFGDQKGMSTGDDETFKKSPYKSMLDLLKINRFK